MSRRVDMHSKPVYTREVIVNLPSGLHMTPSGQLVQMVKKFECELSVRKGDRTVDGSSMLDLMTLAAEHGSVLNLEVRGDRAEEALDAIVRLFERNFEPETQT